MSGLHILLVEEFEARAGDLIASVTAAGHSIFAVPNLDEALEALTIEKFEAVLLGSLPSAEQLAKFTATLRDVEVRQGSATRIVLLSCWGPGESCEMVDLHLPDLSHLCDLRDLIAGFNAACEKPASAEPLPGDLSVFEPVAYEEQCVHDAELMVEVIELFLAEKDEELEGMAAALARQDFEQIARSAHKLKGTLGCLHAPRAWQRAQALEMAAKCLDEAELAGMLELLEADFALLEDHLSAFRNRCLCR